MPTKIVTIIGARPQFIKAAVISRAIALDPCFSEVIIHTGQHFDSNMSDVFFDQMDIPKPHYQLDIHGLNHGAMTGQMLEQIEPILISEKPDWVLVYGDTNSTLAGALAAKKLHIRVAHVEAGLRSFNMDMPEEINRILTDRISDILFCPTQQAIDNLRREGYDHLDIQMINVGDVMQDAAWFYSEKAQAPDIDLPHQFALCTVHRAENTDDATRLQNIFKALEHISVEMPIVLSLHPRTRAKLLALNYDFDNSRIQFVEPQGYLEMVYLLNRCTFVLTDSGGLQKEAFFFKKYGITLRDQTEWVELIEHRVNVLVGSDTAKIIEAAKVVELLDPIDASLSLYGPGDAGKTILRYLG